MSDDSAADSILDRLEALETKLLYQERTVDELNEVVTAQQDRIDALTKEVERMRAIFRELPQAGIEGGEEPPPPHY